MIWYRLKLARWLFLNTSMYFRYFVIIRQTDDGRQAILKAHLSFQLRWAYERYTSHGSFAHNLKNQPRLSRHSSLGKVVLAHNTESTSSNLFTFAWFSNVKCRAKCWLYICSVKQDILLCLVGAIALVFRVIYGTKRYISSSLESSGYLGRSVINSYMYPYFAIYRLSSLVSCLLSYFISACEIWVNTVRQHLMNVYKYQIVVYSAKVRYPLWNKNFLAQYTDLLETMASGKGFNT